MEQTSYLRNNLSPNIIPSSEERTMAILSHVLTFVFPLFAPLIIYLVKKDESEFISNHAKESLNFQITILIISILLVLSIIGLLFLWAVGLGALVLIIVATIKASEGKVYRYPFTIRLIK